MVQLWPDERQALKTMHERVENPWTVETLAAAAGMSRSAFALRFKELVGETPLEYLTNWRMHKATGLLQEDDKKLFEIAKSVGYDSDAAFSKAFKRVLGVAPREYRRSAADGNVVEVAEPHTVGASSKAPSTARNRTRGV